MENSCAKDKLESEGWISAEGILMSAHDAAYVQWGGGWRMPTVQEFDNLVSKCDWTWGKMSGGEGYVVRDKGAYSSASIFLPAAGCGSKTELLLARSEDCYWSSVPEFSGDGVHLRVFQYGLQYRKVTKRERDVVCPEVLNIHAY